MLAVEYAKGVWRLGCVKPRWLCAREFLAPTSTSLSTIGAALAAKFLLNIAAALEIEPGTLAQGAEKRLLTSLRDAAIARPDVEVDLSQTEDFADRFTDWARLISAQQSQITALQQTVSSLSDRLAHDPFLSEALHEVLSTVSAIRSTASILAEPGEMDQNWQRRFQTNVFQDSIRLATASQSLADYLDGDSDRVLGYAVAAG